MSHLCSDYFIEESKAHSVYNVIFCVFTSVSRTLSSSDDVQDRETEKSRLEEAYEKCDRDLDELIVQHYTELTTAIRTYQSITERITNSRNKIKQVREATLQRHDVFSHKVLLKGLRLCPLQVDQWKGTQFFFCSQ